MPRRVLCRGAASAAARGVFLSRPDHTGRSRPCRFRRRKWKSRRPAVWGAQSDDHPYAEFIDRTHRRDRTQDDRWKRRVNSDLFWGGAQSRTRANRGPTCGCTQEPAAAIHCFRIVINNGSCNRDEKRAPPSAYCPRVTSSRGGTRRDLKREPTRRRYYSAIVRTTLEVGRASPPPGPFVSLRISSS
jgi:hypothetical protein